MDRDQAVLLKMPSEKSKANDAVVNPNQDRKFYEPVDMQQQEPKRKGAFRNLFELSPIIGLGLTGAFILTIVKWRGRKNRPPYYPLDMYVLDARVQICGLAIGSIVVGIGADLLLFKAENWKYNKQMKERKQLERDLTARGEEAKIAELTPVFFPFDKENPRPFGTRFVKLFDWK